MGGSARFSVDGVLSSIGRSTIADGATATLLLEDTTDIWKWQVSVVAASKVAQADPPSFSPVTGLAATPSSSIAFLPTALGYGSYWLRSVVNNGKDAAGKTNPDYTFDRIIRILTPTAGLGCPLIAEQQQFDLDFGWAGDVEDMAVVIDGLRFDTNSLIQRPRIGFASGTPTLVAGYVNVLSGTVAAANFPATASWQNKVLFVKKNNIAGAVTLTRAGADLVDGATTFSLAGAYGAARFYCDGTNVWSL
jgi:hypothetical protein